MAQHTAVGNMLQMLFSFSEKALNLQPKSKAVQGSNPIFAKNLNHSLPDLHQIGTKNQEVRGGFPTPIE